MHNLAIKILTALLAVCVVSSAAQAGNNKNSKNKVRQESKGRTNKSEAGSGSGARTPPKIKSCEAQPHTYWDYFSKRCLTIGK